MSAYWLLKTEPSTYSFEDLVREKRTVWSGVSNPAALKNMRGMKKGDVILIYHTGAEKAVVGIAAVAKEAYLPAGESNSRLVVIEIGAGKALPQPVSLGKIKGDKRFVDWDLVKISRLSVVPTTRETFEAVMTLSGEKRLP